MSYSDDGSLNWERPDRPLLVKCSFDRSLRRITFTSARNCSFALFRARVEQCFSLSATTFTISYKDDDGEITDITSDEDLTEAIEYFQAGTEDHSISSAASSASGFSGRPRKITLRVAVGVDYDGPALSDTASLASLDDFSVIDRPLSRSPRDIRDDMSGYSQQLDEDAQTVSSRDVGSQLAPSVGSRRLPATPRHILSSPSHLTPTRETSTPSTSPPSPSLSASPPSSLQPLEDVSNGKTALRTKVDPQEDFAESTYSTQPSLAESSAVFEQLKQAESATERGHRWLEEQNARTMRSTIGPVARSVASVTAENLELDELSLSGEDIRGDLALRQNFRGEWYYSYTSEISSNASQVDGSNVTASDHMDPAPTSSRGLAWIASQQHALSSPMLVGSPKRDSPPRPSSANALSPPTLPPRPSSSSGSGSGPGSAPGSSIPRILTTEVFPTDFPDIPSELLSFIDPIEPLAPPKMVTDCSSCGTVLDSFRYVCATCGEKHPWNLQSSGGSSSSSSLPLLANGKGKSKASSTDNLADPPDVFTYPPYPLSPASSQDTLRQSPSSSPLSSRSSSWTILGSHEHPLSKNKPLPNLPEPSSHSGSSDEAGFELCSNCIESAGVVHAENSSNSTLAKPVSSSPNPTSRSSSSGSERTAKKKTLLRHAFTEKVWGSQGWQDVEQDGPCACTICKMDIPSNRYKCASCSQFDLCRTCYSRVHLIHPSHAFLAIPDKEPRKVFEPLPTVNVQDEDSMVHPGVNCKNCLLEIVGARFHCAICEDVDICANCDSAGLTFPDGRHDSSHIMVKIPSPLESSEVTTASRWARVLWLGRDGPTLGAGPMPMQHAFGRPRAHSVGSSVAPTVVGVGNKQKMKSDDHGILCDACRRSIVGVRYQCAICPSIPKSYNLCAACEVRSYVHHDPFHVFVKLPRPVDIPLESRDPLLPIVYMHPTGNHRGSIRYDSSSQEYLPSLLHNSTLCDRCMDPISGAWYRCAHCGSDLCEDCEQLGVHDSTHVFLVLKSNVDMSKFREVVDVDNPEGNVEIIHQPVYNDTQ